VNNQFNPFIIDTELRQYRYGLTTIYNPNEEQDIVNNLIVNKYFDIIPETIVKLVIDYFRSIVLVGGCIINPCNYNNMDEIFMKYDIDIIHDTSCNNFDMIVAYPPDLLKFTILDGCIDSKSAFALLLPINTLTTDEWVNTVINKNINLKFQMFPNSNQLFWVYGNIGLLNNQVCYTKLESDFEDLNSIGETDNSI
jgi:hypothetical protein